MQTLLDFVSFCTRNFLTYGLEERDQQNGLPARSVLLISVFFVWGYVKDRMFETPVQDTDTLKYKITNAVSSLTTEVLDNML